MWVTLNMSMLKALAAGLCLFLAAHAFAEGPDEKTRIKLAEYMLKTPMNEADPTIVSGFMKLDPESLPKKMRDKVRGKQMEIDQIVKIHSGKKKGPFRFPAACEIKRYEGPEGIRIMGYIIGNVEIRRGRGIHRARYELHRRTTAVRVFAQHRHHEKAGQAVTQALLPDGIRSAHGARGGKARRRRRLRKQVLPGIKAVLPEAGRRLTRPA